VIARLAEQPRGLVLVTGPTGSGKTTTLAAMIDHVNANNAVHIVTIEDPIEVLHAGMQTFDQHLIALYRDGVIELEDALGVASNPHDLKVALRNQGLVA
jgi:Tfp pilus assembly pilus retraction ATPase PilT